MSDGQRPGPLPERPTDQAPRPPTLRCLGGREVPPGILADLAKLEQLGPAARHELWQVLGPTLPDPIPPSAGEAIEAFRTRHGVDGTELAVVLKACRYLIREASRHNLSAPQLAEDLSSLDESGELGRVLLERYEVAKGTIREALARRALLRHGKTLLDAEWRLDLIGATDELRGARVPIVSLTLRYQEAGQVRALTLQVPGSSLRKLQSICNELLASGHG